jgi:hypothetical protein
LHGDNIIFQKRLTEKQVKKVERPQGVPGGVIQDSSSKSAYSERIKQMSDSKKGGFKQKLRSFFFSKKKPNDPEQQS